MKKVLIAIVVIIVLAAIGGVVSGGKSSTSSSAASTSVSSASSAAQEQEQILVYTLIDGTAGDYGEIVTVNEGTDFQNTDTAFTVPAGDYVAKNLSATGAVQITFFSNQGFQDVDGHQERISGTNSPVVIMGGKSANINVAEGDIIILSDGGSVELTPPQNSNRPATDSI